MEKMVQIFHKYEGDEDSKFFGDRAVVDYLNTKIMITDTLQHLVKLKDLLYHDVKVWGSTEQSLSQADSHSIKKFPTFYGTWRFITKKTQVFWDINTVTGKQQSEVAWL